MNKLIRLSIVLYALLFSFAASATPLLIDETEYVSFGGYDWAWASPFNVQFFADASCDIFAGDFNPDDYLVDQLTDINNCGNQLLAPDAVAGWGFVETTFENDSLFNSFSSISDFMLHLYNLDNNHKNDVLSIFTVDGNDGQFIRAFDVWNSNNGLTHFDGNPFASQWNEASQNRLYDVNGISAQANNPFQNTVYVKASAQAAPEPVPEPTSILLLGLGVLLIALRRR